MNYVEFEELFAEFIGDQRLRLPGIMQTLAALRVHPGGRLLDLAAGRGETAALMNALGYAVDANEVEGRNREAARRRLRQYGVCVFPDAWQEMSRALAHAARNGLYDAVFSDGNSFPTYLPHNERGGAMRQFSGLLRRGGIISVDFRNYEVWPVGVPFPLEKKWHYFGPMPIAGFRHGDGRITLGYIHDTEWSKLELHEVTLDQTVALLAEAGFEIDATYVDGERRMHLDPRAESPHAFVCVVGRKSRGS